MYDALMTKRTDKSPEDILREALAPLVAAGITGDQAERLVWASFNAARRSDGTTMTDFITEVFPFSPPSRPCRTEDVHFTYTNDDDGVHLRCSHCNGDTPIGYTPNIDDIDKALRNHILQSTEDKS